MTEWERTGDVKWRDRILAGVDSIVAMPYWFRTGQLNGLNPDIGNGVIGPLKGGGSMTVGYDTATGKLTAFRDPVDKAPVLRQLQSLHHPRRRGRNVRDGPFAQSQGFRHRLAAPLP